MTWHEDEKLRIGVHREECGAFLQAGEQSVDFEDGGERIKDDATDVMEGRDREIEETFGNIAKPARQW